MKNELGALMLWIDRILNRNQDVLVTKIDSIQNLFETSAEASASASDILEGKTAYNGTALITGTMENQGAREATLLAGGTYNIPRGYHDGAGRVIATDLASQTPGTAVAGGILSGLKAWVAGKLIDGAMKDRRGTTVTAAAVTQDDEYTYLSIPEEACFDSNSKIRTENSNIKKLPELELVEGTYVKGKNEVGKTIVAVCVGLPENGSAVSSSTYLANIGGYCANTNNDSATGTSPANSLEITIDDTAFYAGWYPTAQYAKYVALVVK